MDIIVMTYFISAYGEVIRVPSNIEDNITGADVQKVLVILSHRAVQEWVLRCD